MIIREQDFHGFICGEEKAFEHVFRQYFKTLVSFAMRYGINDMEAEDIVLEVMHHIWEIREDVKSSSALHSLLYTSVRNRCFNVIRNLKNRERILEAQEPEEKDEKFYEYLMEEEITHMIDCAVTELPTQCRQVVLCLLNGKTINEIAQEMGISVNSVKTYKLRSIEILRKTLKNYPFLLWLITFRIII